MNWITQYAMNVKVSEIELFSKYSKFPSKVNDFPY